MIKLTIPEPTKNKKYYSIYLGPSLKFDFTNKKKAKTFKSHIEILLNNSIETINEIYTDVFNNYRSMYLFINSRFEQIQITNTVNEIEKQFLELTAPMYKTTSNGAYFIYSKLLNLFQEVKNLNRNITAIAFEKRQYTIQKKCSVNTRQLLSELEFLLELKDNLFNNKQIKKINYEFALIA